MRDVERQLHGVALTVVDVQIVVRLGQHDVPRIGTHLVDVAVVDRHTLREGQLHVLGQIAHVAVQRAVVERQRPVVFEVADFVVFEQKRAGHFIKALDHLDLGRTALRLGIGEIALVVVARQIGIAVAVERSGRIATPDIHRIVSDVQRREIGVGRQRTVEIEAEDIVASGIVLVFDGEVDPIVARPFVVIVALVVSFGPHALRQCGCVGSIGFPGFSGVVISISLPLTRRSGRFVLFGIGRRIVVAARRRHADEAEGSRCQQKFFESHILTNR